MQDDAVAPPLPVVPGTVDGTLAASKDSRQPSAFHAEVGVADGVNTAMDAVQAAGGDTAPYAACRNTGNEELS